MTALSVFQADLSDPVHAAGVLHCIDAYAADPMGSGAPLPQEVREAMVPGLAATPGSLAWLATEEGAPIGAIVGFQCYSTFAAKPRWNVHDISVVPEARGRGVGRALLEAVIADAAAAGCVAVTLEVRHDNAPARHLYASLGFGDGFAPMDFWERKLG